MTHNSDYRIGNHRRFAFQGVEKDEDGEEVGVTWNKWDVIRLETYDKEPTVEIWDIESGERDLIMVGEESQVIEYLEKVLSFIRGGVGGAED